MGENDKRLPPIVTEFLKAVERRDPAAVGRCFTDDAVHWFTVPAYRVAGRDAVEEAFARVLGEADRVVDGDRMWPERIDRFWYGGTEAAIECAGVVEIADGRIAAVRDYCDVRNLAAAQVAGHVLIGGRPGSTKAKGESRWWNGFQPGRRPCRTPPGRTARRNGSGAHCRGTAATS